MDYRYLVFDFDGVLAESNEIRFREFENLFADIDVDARARFMEFVKANGGSCVTARSGILARTPSVLQRKRRRA